MTFQKLRLNVENYKDYQSLDNIRFRNDLQEENYTYREFNYDRFNGHLIYVEQD